MKESDIQKQILNYLTARGAYSVNVMQASKNGVPDILACYKGAFIGIEVKLPGKKPSALQLQNIQAIRAGQGWAKVCYNTADARILLDEIEMSQVYRES